MVRRVRQITEKKIGEEGGARAHQGSRNRADTLTDVADSGERFLRFGGASSWKKKGGRRRTSGGFYWQALDGQLVHGDGAGLTPASFHFQRERGNGGGDDADRWGPACQSGRWAPPSAGELREGTDSGFNPGWAVGSFLF
jgi:hypothetical protein